VVEDIEKYKDSFLSEAKEHLASMNKSLLKLEKNPTELELANDIIRAAHTLKSMAATMNYHKMAGLCHAMEDVLEAIKKKKVKLGKCVDILFECFDTLELSSKEVSQDKEELDMDGLVQKLHTLVVRDEGQKTRDEETESSAGQDTEAIDRPSSITPAITSIEVKVERLDLLMNLAEELLINKMRLDRIKETLQEPELSAAVDTLGRLIADVQYNVMQARMVPIGFVFNRFPRMVRDLAKQEKKEVNLEMEGEDIELDRAIVEEIAEPLVHLLRNAIDHGIETPQERSKVGKSAKGTIKLTAKRTKGFAIIEVEDDGKGLNFEDMKKTAVKLGTLSPGATEEEVTDSIFSGLSTTKEVTTVSGRGFGLNIVKKKIKSLGGSIKIESHLRRGTRFVIEMPLTLAVVKTLFVEVGGKIYAIPLANIDRLVNVNEEDIKGMLSYEAIVLNEEDIPITRLNVLFDTAPLAHQTQSIVIIRKGEEKLGLAVDGLMSTQEIVLKPLNKLVKENKYFAGCSIIGSGEVVLVLDVGNLILSKRDQRPRMKDEGPARPEGAMVHDLS